MYANIIVDISIEKLDRPFQYLIPEELESLVTPGVQVEAPFGSRTITGYVIEVTEQLTDEIAADRIRPITKVLENSVAIESQLVALAAWMRSQYGSTMNQALKTVIPVKKKAKPVEHKWVHRIADREEAERKLALYEEKHAKAKARLLRELLEEETIEWSLVIGKLNIAAPTIKALEKDGMVEIESRLSLRNPIQNLTQKGYDISLNTEQQAIVDRVSAELAAGHRRTYLLKGVTGSGKTEVYMELIARILNEGKQAIVLIPEIALTYQTVMRFYNRFGERVSIINSRMTPAERYDQYLRAKNGEVDIIIGPRSALFAPFPKLGLIIIDEEHETSYKSETAPRYHAREVAIRRGEMTGASVILGSATPSLESYYQATEGDFILLSLNSRVEERPLPECRIVDMREELKKGNCSILSRDLQDLMEDRLSKGQQTMLFLNRRGLAGFVSCRSCGTVIKCPHCDVSLSQHRGKKLICHYCGYETEEPKVCPECGSKYISGFKAGTEKVEEMVLKRFPKARVLRMDYDTTRTRDSYENILSAFGNGEADILIGTQMIVKGHDFANVTLVGILAADMSLHVSDFHGPERTFDLITQAAGRAGRGSQPGDVVIQCYSPEHYAICTAKDQDYEAFYQKEIAYRKLMHYPPAENLFVILLSHADEKVVTTEAENLKAYIDKLLVNHRRDCQAIGPAEASIAKLNDIYRRVIYLKSGNYSLLVAVKDRVESKSFYSSVQFDFNPVSGF